MFEVTENLIGKERVEHVAQDLSRGRHGGRRTRCNHACVLTRAYPDDEETFRTEVDGGTHGIQLAHGPVAEILVPERQRREQQGDGDARHEVLEREARAPADALYAAPLLD